MNPQYTVSYASSKHTHSLIKMWKSCFSNTDQFDNFYFNKVYNPNENLILIIDNTIVASLQIIPYRLQIANSLSQGGYIFGVMTHPDHRKKGYMAQLLNASFDEMIKKGYDYTFLIPEKRWLARMYEKYGFRLLKSNPQPPVNKVLKSPEQWELIKQNYFDDYEVWLKEEIYEPKEHKGMIKRLNTEAEEITTLYMGMMLD